MGTIATALLSLLAFIEFTAWRAIAPCITEHKVPVNGITMHVDVYDCTGDNGNPATLLLLHGGGASLDSYYQNLPELSQHFRIIAPDTRAHGRSTDQVEQPYSYELLAADMAEMVKALGYESVHVTGWSDGGIIAKTMAMNHAEQVDKLILIASLFNQSGYKPEARERLANATPEDWEPDAKSLYEFVSDTPEYWPTLFEKARRMWLSAPNYTAEDVGNIQAETLLIVSDTDEYIRYEHSELLRDAIPSANMFVFENEDHMFPETRATEVNQLLVDFIYDQDGNF